MMIRKIALYSLAGMGVLYIGLSFMSFNSSEKQYIQVPIYKNSVQYVPVGATLSNEQIDALISYMKQFYPEEYAKIVSFYANITGNKEVAETILKYCIEYSVPINMGFAMIKQESNFNPRAYNENPSSIDRGLCMLNNRAFPKWKWRDFYNMDKNAKAGIQFISYLLNRFKDSTLQEEMALSAYNEGISAIESNYIPYSTSIHVFKIKEFEKEYTFDFNTKLLPLLNHVKFSEVSKNNS